MTYFFHEAKQMQGFSRNTTRGMTQQQTIAAGRLCLWAQQNLCHLQVRERKRKTIKLDNNLFKSSTSSHWIHLSFSSVLIGERDVTL